uniref:Uncharacterized protein n=1 Tax=Magallana gigas TaxID=29159 RepID=A0A8W8LYF1_MAGGI
MFLLFISTVVLMHSRGDTSNQNCWSQAIDIYNSFSQTVCQNTSYNNRDHNRWLPAVCKDICTVQINTSCTKDVSLKFNLTNEMTNNVIVNEYAIVNCSECHQLRLVLITCKTDGITCTDCTNAKSETDISSTISTCPQTVGYLVLTSLLGLVFGILVSLGLWLIKTKFVKRKL